jgi:hypothetical protein
MQFLIFVLFYYQPKALGLDGVHSQSAAKPLSISTVSSAQDV